MNKKAQLSVVIASIGRPGLTKILQDITKSSAQFAPQIILVLDGVEANDPNVKLWKELSSKVLINPTQLGPSVSYSRGIAEVKTPYFRIFTDDDEWDALAFEESMIELEPSTVLVCQTNSHDEFGSAIRNSNFPPELSPLESVYCPILPWKRNIVYFHLTSMIFPIEVAQVNFDETLPIREDLDWLQKIYYAGIKFKFSKIVLSSVNPSHVRSFERQTLDIDLAWTLRLKLVSRALSKQFVYFHCYRSAALVGKPSVIFKGILRLYRIVGPPNIKEFAAISFYLLIAVLKKLKSR